MFKRYNQSMEYVELTQKYFDDLQSQFAQMMFHYSRNSPENYKNFCNEYSKKVIENA